MVGTLLPFAGTVLGSTYMFFLKPLKKKVGGLLTGFATGVMVAASVWSLLIPTMGQSKNMRRLAFVPASIGFLLGVGFLLCIDGVAPHLHMYSSKPEGIKGGLSKHAVILLAVTIHNIPKGMTADAVLTAIQAERFGITIGAVLALIIGIAVQDFPEGAIIATPLHNDGLEKKEAFVLGMLSGVAEPIGTILALLMVSTFTPILPYFLNLTIGTVIYVMVEELVPEMSEGKHSNIGVIAFSIEFVLAMILDIFFE